MLKQTSIRFELELSYNLTKVSEFISNHSDNDIFDLFAFNDDSPEITFLCFSAYNIASAKNFARYVQIALTFSE
jgi:hypothetical protein